MIGRTFVSIGRAFWTASQILALVKGRNVLHFTRPDPSRGVTIKELTLKPLK